MMQRNKKLSLLENKKPTKMQLVFFEMKNLFSIATGLNPWQLI
jgi:hypothetical protein